MGRGKNGSGKPSSDFCPKDSLWRNVYEFLHSFPGADYLLPTIILSAAGIVRFLCEDRLKIDLDLFPSGVHSETVEKVIDRL